MIDRRVLFFGDSLVAGVGDPEGRGWVGRIVASSFNAGMPLTAYNLGVRRQTSVEIAARFHAEAAPRLTPGAECGVVFSFGANDTTIEAGLLRVELAQSLKSLGAVLNRAAGLNLRTLVVGPAPVDDAEQTDRIAELSHSLGRICAERSVPFVDTVGELRDSEVWRQEMATGDGAHPGAPGYELLADLVLTAGWHDWLRAKSSPSSSRHRA